MLVSVTLVVSLKSANIKNLCRSLLSNQTFIEKKISDLSLVYIFCIEKQNLTENLTNVTITMEMINSFSRFFY